MESPGSSVGYRRHLTQYGHALTSALETAGTVALRGGDKPKALRIAREVVRLRSDFPYFTTLARGYSISAPGVIPIELTPKATVVFPRLARLSRTET